jgi:mono/diheme cytochrome c family protein
MKAISIVVGTAMTMAWILFFAIVVWMLLMVGANPASAADGKDIYAKSCANCHGKTGKGDGVAAAALKPKPTDLTNKAAMSKLKDDDLFNVISKGGAAVGKSPLMPGFKGQLKDADIKNVISYIRSLAK